MAVATPVAPVGGDRRGCRCGRVERGLDEALAVRVVVQHVLEYQQPKVVLRQLHLVSRCQRIKVNVISRVRVRFRVNFYFCYYRVRY